jgi:hypothetical protein
MAEPMAPLGVNNPVLQVLLVVAVAELPGVKTIEHLDGVLFTHSYLHAYVRRSRSIIEKIGLQR